MLKKILEASNYIKTRIDIKPEIGLILGSGLGDLANEITDKVIIKYDEIPHFPISTIEGHAGNFVFGTLENKKVAVMQGRFHYYEGYTMQEVVFPVRVMKALGIDTLIITNACGGMNKELYPGALMIIEDHINFMGDNPLIGRNYDELGPRFPDMSHAYNESLIKVAIDTAKDIGIEVKKGVYAAISGPYYFSRAELKMLRTIGGDVIGMSTVPEVIAANHMAMKVLGISCITDMAIAEEIESISHEEVMEVANEAKPKFINLTRNILKRL
ncbi:purine-nucleoside phosphorylase [Abyssisolibacter fermentans]|uniref:purine-nucleoside phosphorylase n=1 Tax=Abyssisolibacter fermentans TaxID=1766203 RepID=UPI00083164F1|nr:purine-nucleoside phosphorylase [Abyssisolibacter fermentans]